MCSYPVAFLRRCAAALRRCELASVNPPVRVGGNVSQTAVGAKSEPSTRHLRVLSPRQYLSPIAAVAVMVTGFVTAVGAPAASASPGAAQDPPSCANPVACENQRTGTPQSTWDVSASQGGTIEGFADPFSINAGQTISFKIKSPASSYAIDIYRMGYYGGDGARLITSITPDISASQNQPACDTNTTTGLVDCGNWSMSATWPVPDTAVSGVYFARIYRTDGTSDANQIPFVVTDNSSHSGIVFMTSDETWQAYNDWGGYSLYTGNATGSPW
jgi:hypothetical protein